MSCCDKEASKAFFFEKKKQKAFASAVAVFPCKRATAEAKVFCFFFSKKKALLFTYLLRASNFDKYPTISFGCTTAPRTIWSKCRVSARMWSVEWNTR